LRNSAASARAAAWRSARADRGARAEALAAAYLEGKGLRIVTRNYRCRGGEIDLIALEGATTVFVEVRLRSSSDYGGAGESIQFFKRRRILMAARYFLAGRAERLCRFDAVLLDRLAPEAIQWVRNAFSAD
jgi:putative endonuclease